MKNSPLLGFNNNVRHKGRVFHIQTEDSGVKHPHIITHLFADGGRILKTTKTSYAEHIGSEGMQETVRHLMQEQHKAMFIALRDGQFDHLLEDIPPAPGPPPRARPTGGSAEPRAGATAPGADAPAGTPPAAGAPATLPAPVGSPEPAVAIQAPPSAQKAASRPKIPIDANALLAPDARHVSPTAVTMVGVPPGGQGPAGPDHAVAHGASRRDAPAAMAPTEPPQPGAEVDLDLDALERAAAEAQTPFFQQIRDLPPPPATVLGKRASSETPTRDTSYRAVGKSPPADGAAASAPATRSRAGSAPDLSRARPSVTSAEAAQGAGRYAPSRPAPIFHASRPVEGASIFGEDLISEKSLDEVILSYLAEDLDAPSEKK